VTVDRVSRGVAAILMLILIQPWGLQFTWQQLSYVSLALIVLWYVNAFRARREYLTALRQSLERHDVQPARLRLDVADLSTVEPLMKELASPRESRVLYAIRPSLPRWEGALCVAVTQSSGETSGIRRRFQEGAAA
jgi:hypothetical protein